MSQDFLFISNFWYLFIEFCNILRCNWYKITWHILKVYSLTYLYICKAIIQSKTWSYPPPANISSSPWAALPWLPSFQTPHPSPWENADLISVSTDQLAFVRISFQWNHASSFLIWLLSCSSYVETHSCCVSTICLPTAEQSSIVWLDWLVDPLAFDGFWGCFHILGIVK